MIHKIVITDGLKPCPLCGADVQMTVYGGLFLSTPHEVFPVYNVRTEIKCQYDFLTLDLGWNGYADADGKTDGEQKTMLEAIMRVHAESAKNIWNKRVKNEHID